MRLQFASSISEVMRDGVPKADKKQKALIINRSLASKATKLSKTGGNLTAISGDIPVVKTASGSV